MLTINYPRQTRSLSRASLDRFSCWWKAAPMTEEIFYSMHQLLSSRKAYTHSRKNITILTKHNTGDGNHDGGGGSATTKIDNPRD